MQARFNIRTLNVWAAGRGFGLCVWLFLAIVPVSHAQSVRCDDLLAITMDINNYEEAPEIVQIGEQIGEIVEVPKDRILELPLEIVPQDGFEKPDSLPPGLFPIPGVENPDEIPELDPSKIWPE